MESLREFEERLNDIVQTTTGRRKFDHVFLLYRNLSLLLELAKFMYQLSFKVRLNNIVQTMTGRRKFDHVSPLYKNLSLLKLQDIYILELAKFMYQLSFNKLPKIIESAFPKIENIHNHNTRHTQNTKFFFI